MNCMHQRAQNEVFCYNLFLHLEMNENFGLKFSKRIVLKFGSKWSIGLDECPREIKLKVIR